MTKQQTLLLLLLLAAAVPTTGSAQSVEMMFTPGVVQQALVIKGALKVEKLDSFGALALVGAAAASSSSNSSVCCLVMV